MAKEVGVGVELELSASVLYHFGLWYVCFDFRSSRVYFVGSLQKGLGDFERFQMMVARKTRAKAVNKAVKAMTKGKK